VVSLIERDHAVKLVSFCSNHDLGTALPPPSVGGLRPNSPVTCGFSTSRPALSRRPCAAGAGTTRFLGRSGAHAKARGRNLPPSVDVQFVPVLTSLCRRAGMLRQAFGRDRIPPSRPRSRRLHPRAASAGARSSRAASPRSRMASFISELASHEVPGFGAPALRRLSASKPLRPPWRSRGTTASPHPAGGGDPVSAAAATCSRTKCRDVASLPVQRHPRGSNRVGEGGRVNEELSGSPGEGGDLCEPERSVTKRSGDIWSVPDTCVTPPE